MEAVRRLRPGVAGRLPPRRVSAPPPARGRVRDDRADPPRPRPHHGRRPALPLPTSQGPALRRREQGHDLAEAADPGGLSTGKYILALVVIFLTAIYGGYFAAAQGIILVALLGSSSPMTCSGSTAQERPRPRRQHGLGDDVHHRRPRPDQLDGRHLRGRRLAHRRIPRCPGGAEVLARPAAHGHRRPRARRDRADPHPVNGHAL